jgi:hypothetical protein
VSHTSSLPPSPSKSDETFRQYCSELIERVINGQLTVTEAREATRVLNKLASALVERGAAS